MTGNELKKIQKDSGLSAVNFVKKIGYSTPTFYNNALRKEQAIPEAMETAVRSYLDGKPVAAATETKRSYKVSPGKKAAKTRAYRKANAAPGGSTIEDEIRIIEDLDAQLAKRRAKLRARVERYEEEVEERALAEREKAAHYRRVVATTPTDEEHGFRTDGDAHHEHESGATLN